MKKQLDTIRIMKNLIVVKDGKTYYFDVRDDNDEELVTVAIKAETQSFCTSFKNDELSSLNADEYAFLRENVIGKLTNDTSLFIKSGYMSPKEGEYLTTKTAEERIIESLGKTPIDVEEDIAKTREKQDAKVLSGATRDYMDSRNKKPEDFTKYPELNEPFYQDNGYAEENDTLVYGYHA